jgi:WD40 repeat protein
MAAMPYSGNSNHSKAKRLSKNQMAGGLRLIQGGFLLSTRVLSKDPAQVRGQLSGRLLGFKTPEIQSIVERASHGRENPWLRPLAATLTQSGGPFRCAFMDDFSNSKNAIAITADGRYALACVLETVKVFDLGSGRERLSFHGHKAAVNSVAVAPDGSKALSVSEDGTLKLWDLESGHEMLSLRESDWEEGLVVTPDCRRSVSGSIARLKIWDLENGALLNILEVSESQTDSVFPLSISEDGHKLVVHSGERLSIIDAETGRELRFIKVGPGCAAAALDGRHAISCVKSPFAYDASRLVVWDLDSGRELRTLGGDEKRIKCVAITPDGHWAVSSSDEEIMKVWDVSSGAVMAVFRGQDGIHSVAISANGRRMISCGNSELRAWDLALGEDVRIFSEHGRGVEKIALSPDGQKLVSASSEELKVWDLKTGKILKAVAVKRSKISALAVTPDGRRAISIWSRAPFLDFPERLEAQKPGIQGVVSVDLVGKEKSRVISSDPDLIGALAVAPNGNWAYSGYESLYKWDTETGEKLEPSEELVEAGVASWDAVAITSDGRRLVSAAGSSSEDVPIIYVWDLERAEILHTFEGHEGRINDIAIRPDDRQVVSASQDETLKVWDIESGKVLQTLRGHTASVNAVALTSDGRYAISGSDDQTIKMWDLEAGREVRSLEGHQGPVHVVKVTPDGLYAVSGSSDKTIRVWKLEPGMETEIPERHEMPVCAVAVAMKEPRVISTSRDELMVWSLKTKKVLRSWKGRQYKEDWWACIGGNAVLSLDGKQALTIAAKGLREYPSFLCRWNLEYGLEAGFCETIEEIVYGLGPGAEFINAVATTPDLRRAVCGCGDNTVRVWDLKSEKEICRLEGHTGEVTSVAVTKNGLRAISASLDKTLRVWNLDSKKGLVVLEGHRDCVRALALSYDERWIVSGSDDREIRLWDFSAVQDERLPLPSSLWIRTLKGHVGSVRAVAIGPDSRYIVSASWDDMLKVWDLKGTREIASFTAETRMQTCCVASDGRTIIAGDDHGWVHFLRLENIDSSAGKRKLR